jgi:peptidoglycan/LPS O-acetylase OafA/YrhL
MTIHLNFRSQRSSTSSAPGFFPCLESLRSVCALTVALFHVSWTNHVLLVPGMDRAWTFVDFFFVLSGFVISNAYMDSVRDLGNAGRFMIRRIFRLYPMHLVTLIAVGMLQFVGWQFLGRGNPFGAEWPTLLALNLVLSHAIGLSSSMILNVPSWSISIEFYAYLLFCAWCLAARKLGIWTLLAATIVVSSLAIMMFINPEYGLSTPANSSLARGMFGFFLGVLITLFRKHVDLRVVGYISDVFIVMIAATIIGVMIVFGEHSHVLFILPPLFAVLVVALISADGSTIVEFLENRLFRKFGLISYSIYMNHVIILMFFSYIAGTLSHGPKVLAEHGTLHNLPLFLGDVLAAGYIAVLLLVSWLTYWLIENPGRRVGRHLADRAARP